MLSRRSSFLPHSLGASDGILTRLTSKLQCFRRSIPRHQRRGPGWAADSGARGRLRADLRRRSTDRPQDRGRGKEPVRPRGRGCLVRDDAGGAGGSRRRIIHRRARGRTGLRRGPRAGRPASIRRGRPSARRPHRGSASQASGRPRSTPVRHRGRRHRTSGPPPAYQIGAVRSVGGRNADG